MDRGASYFCRGAVPGSVRALSGRCPGAGRGPRLDLAWLSLDPPGPPTMLQVLSWVMLLGRARGANNGMPIHVSSFFTAIILFVFGTFWPLIDTAESRRDAQQFRSDSEKILMQSRAGECTALQRGESPSHPPTPHSMLGPWLFGSQDSLGGKGVKTCIIARKCQKNYPSATLALY